MTSIVPQQVVSRLTRAAIFLVVNLKPETAHDAVVRGLCRDIDSLVRAVGFRDLDGGLACVMGFGSSAWERLFQTPRPAELHPFREIRGEHHAVSTQGDLLFHIRAMSPDLCFELAMHVMSRLGDAVLAVDEVHGFKYYDQRDLLGFVDGTEDPADQRAIDAAIVGEEDPAFACGSYCVVQK